MTARRPTNCGTGSSNWQIKTRRGAGMKNPVRPEQAASERARLATNRDLPTLGSPPTNRMPCGGNSTGSTRQGGALAGWRVLRENKDMDAEYLQTRRVWARLPSRYEGDDVLAADWAWMRPNVLPCRQMCTWTLLRTRPLLLITIWWKIPNWRIWPGWRSHPSSERI